MIELKDKKDCCGCNACVQKCPVQCIEMKEDFEGFLYPTINQEECINCGLCEKVCPIISQGEIRSPLKTYAAINKDEKIRLDSSSGGVFTLLAEHTIRQNGVVFGAQFDNNFTAIHNFTETINGLTAFRGSKYIQSIIGDNYKKAEQFLKRGREVLFTGTPCQIAGLKHFLRNEYKNLLTVDIVCHGVPSPKVFRLYLEELSLQQNGRLEKIQFRDKTEGWKKYSFATRRKVGKNTVSFRQTLDKNDFMQGFLQNLYLRPSCHACPSKAFKSGADITCGDFWGINNYMPEVDDNKGVSLLLINSFKAEQILTVLGKDIHLIDANYSVAIMYNTAIIKPNIKHKNRELFFKLIEKNGFKKTTSICLGVSGKSLKSLIKLSSKKVFSGLGLFVITKVLYDKIRFIYAFLSDNLSYLIACCYVCFLKPSSEKRILLVPAADLNGGFGEDIMVAAFIDHFKDTPIEIFTENLILRDDIFQNNQNVYYSGGFRKGKYIHMLNRLKNCSDLYVIGADILDGHYNNGLYNIEIIRFQILKFANKLGVVPHISGFSVSKELSVSIVKQFKKTSLFIDLKVRDIDSYVRLEKIVGKDKLILTSDIAFLSPDKSFNGVDIQYNEYQNWIKKRMVTKSKIIAVCPNIIQAHRIGIEKYLTDISSLLEIITQKHKCSLVFLYHDLRDCSNGLSDRDLSEYLFHYFSKFSFFTNKITNGIELKLYIKLVDMTLTGRMHFGISGYTLGKPMFGICYNNKFEGLQRMFEISIENSLIDYRSINDAKKNICTFLGELESNKKKVIQFLPNLQKLCLKNFE